MPKFLKSKLFIAAGTLVLGLLVTFWGREAWHRYQVEQEIKKMQAQIVEARSGSARLEEALAYLKTSEYKERQARQLLGLQKPGEFVVALPAEQEEAEEGSVSQNGESNLRQWWEYFFGNK